MSTTALFVSHGAPTLLTDEVPARGFMQGLAAAIGRPQAILAVSAHWTTASPKVGGAERPETIHDFAGFPEELYRLHYPAKGDPALAARAVACLDNARLDASIDPGRGLDHGTWAPMMLIWPDADIPVIPVSLQPNAGSAHYPGADSAHHYGLGQALRPLTDEGVLVLATGGATHDLSGLWGQTIDAPPVDYAQAFDDWLCGRIEAGALSDLLAYREKGPSAARNHPTEEHIQPLFVALGAAGGGPGRCLHRSFTFGAISMAAYAFG
ncbi:MAG: dioxygenase [bacterium]|nr:dioxygenase [bacterium]